MLKRANSILMMVFFSLDVMLCVVALHISDWLRKTLPLGKMLTEGTVYLDASVYLSMALISALVFLASPFYTSRRISRLLDELSAVGWSVLVIFLLFAAWLFFLGYDDFSRVLLAYFGIIATVLLVGFHVFLRLFLRAIRVRQYNQRRMLIVGAGTTGQAVAQSVLEHPWAGFIVEGFLDDDPEKHGQILLAGLPVLGPLNQAPTLVRNLKVDEVVIALPADAHVQLVEFVESLSEEPVNIRVVPDLFGVATVRTQIEDLWGIPVVGIRNPVLSTVDAVVKRMVDMAGSLTALVVFAPVMLVAAILIKKDSSGPVFFIQERVGENGRVFRMYKFRTMVTNAEAMLDDLVQIDKLPEPVFKIKNDPRVTKIGRALRCLSIDELPQLFNVLKGEMSLVGPRPEEVRVVREYSRWHRQRLVVKPGMTGPMQVSGRGDLTLKERVEMELVYILDYSLWKDIKIMLRTVLAVFQRTGT